MTGEYSPSTQSEPGGIPEIPQRKWTLLICILGSTLAHVGLGEEDSDLRAAQEALSWDPSMEAECLATGNTHR